MPIKVTVRNPPDNAHIFDCRLNPVTGKPKECKRCTAKNKRGARCKNKSCFDLNYCWVHLRALKKLQIGPSRLPGVGKGLFAQTTKKVLTPAQLLKLNTTPYGQRADIKAQFLVFDRGDIIGKYVGEAMTKPELDKRYAHDVGGGVDADFTAPYGVETENGRIFDSLCHRNFVSYANDPRGSNLQENAKLLDNLQLKATRRIWKGEEILWKYGADYWDGDQPDVTEKRV